MSETRVPEWFIGGPLHGKDRLTECPYARTAEIRYPHFEHFDAADPFNERATVTEYTYRRTTFAIGRTELTIWVLYGMDRGDAADRLAEILLAPHLAAAR